MVKFHEILQLLLNDLERVSEDHDEVFDTAVREKMFDSIFNTFISPISDFEFPNEFGMFSSDGNRAVGEAIQRFLTDSSVFINQPSFATPKERLDAFQTFEIVSEQNGYTFDEFFGYFEGL